MRSLTVKILGVLDVAANTSESFLQYSNISDLTHEQAAEKGKKGSNFSPKHHIWQYGIIGCLHWLLKGSLADQSDKLHLLGRIG